MVFNVPKRFLPYCALAGAMGHSTRTFLMHFNMPIEWATFAAAAVVGFVTIHFAKKHLAPPLMYAVAAIIPMVPGTYAFNTVIALIQLTAANEINPEISAHMTLNALKTVFILGALAVGLALPSLLFYRNRNIL
ncbi:threonine/serine exporter [Shewanella intestini]|uniref:Threonine/serine exporter n=2 Tax=Shewanellaceae TaxID=267890 RepID=A0ABS5HXI1_9GAMM|nr:threonine/serine exporter [Shewanella intestini]MRG35032.1 threonine/serine exporter [Shewanella sp. XMDDZSB0408]